MCRFCDRTEGLCLCVWSDRLEPSSSDSRRQESDCRFSFRLLCCKCSFCYQVASKEGHKSQLLSQVHRNKMCERCFLCRSLEFCKSGDKCPTCCYRSTCRGKATQFLGEVGSSGFQSKSSHHTQRRLHPPLPVQTEPNNITIISNYPNPFKQAHLLEILFQLVNKNAVEPVANQNSLGFYNWLFLVPQPNNWWRPVLDLSILNTFLNTEPFKMETPETIRTSLQSGEWVTSIDFKDAYSIYQFTVNPGSTCVFTSRVGPTSSKPYPLAYPQHPWSSQWWPRRSS